jgi:hypothetical protein
VRTELTNQGLERSQVSRGREIFLKLKKIVDRQNAATMIRDPEAARRKPDASRTSLLEN